MNSEQQLEGLTILNGMIHECKMMSEQQRNQQLFDAMEKHGRWYQLTKRLHTFCAAAAMWAFLNDTCDTSTDHSEEYLAGYLRAERNYNSWLAYRGGHPVNCICTICVYLDSLEPVEE